MFRPKRTDRPCGRVSPVDRALLFGYDGLQVGELEEAVVEVVQMENTHEQEGSWDENPGEEFGHGELLKPEVLKAARRDRFRCKTCDVDS